MLERTRRKCLDLRNRLYPEQEWPGVIHRQSVISAGGADRTLLEIGCGRELVALREAAAAFRWSVGIDLEIAVQAPPGAGWAAIQADAHHLPVRPCSIDVIAMADVLEHIADPVCMFQECARVLRPGGCLIVSTVNRWFPPIVVGRLMPHRVKQMVNRLATDTDPNDTFPAYYRANSRSALVGAVRKAGFKPLTFRYLSQHPHYLMFSVTLYRLGIVYERLVRRTERLRTLRPFLHGVFAKYDRDKETAV